MRTGRGHVERIKLKDGRTKFIVVMYAGSVGGKEKRVWRRFDTLREAQAFARKMADQLDTGGMIPTTRLRVGEYLDGWLREIKENLSPTTYVSYEGIVARSLKPGLGHISLSRLSPPLIQAWLTAQREAKRVCSTTTLFHFRVLHRALARAVELGMIGANPCDRCTPPRKERPILPQWDDEELRLFLAQAKKSSTHYALYLTAILTGMRRGELLGLRWADIDFLLKTATVQQTHYEVSGKVGFKPPKSLSSRRTLDLPETVMEEFRRIRDEQQKARALMGDGYASLDLIFAQSNGRPLYGDNLSKDFHRVIKRAKVKRIRFHDLRHLHAGLLIDQGTNSRLISERLGHSSVSFTLQQYGFLMKGAQREAVSKLEERLLGKGGRDGRRDALSHGATGSDVVNTGRNSLDAEE